MNTNNERKNKLIKEIPSNLKDELNNNDLINIQNLNNQSNINQNFSNPTIDSKNDNKNKNQNQRYLKTNSNTSESNINNSFDNDYPNIVTSNQLSFNPKNMNLSDDNLRRLIKNEINNSISSYKDEMKKNSVSKYDYNEGINDVYRYLKTFNSTLKNIQNNVDNIEKDSEKNYVNKKEYDYQIKNLLEQINKIYYLINSIGKDLKDKIENIDYTKQVENNLFKDKLKTITNEIKIINDNLESNEKEYNLIFLKKDEFDRKRNDINNKIREMSKSLISKDDFENKIKDINNKIKEKTEKIIEKDDFNDKINDIENKIEQNKNNFINKFDFNNSYKNIMDKIQENENYFIKKNDFDNKIKVLENKIRDIEKNTLLKTEYEYKINDFQEIIKLNEKFFTNSIDEIKKTIEENNLNIKEKNYGFENLIERQKKQLEKTQQDFDNLKKKINFNKLSKINLNDIMKLNYNELSKLNFDEIKTIPRIKDEIELIKSLNRDNEFDIKILQNKSTTHQNKIDDIGKKLRTTNSEIIGINKRSFSHRPSFSEKNENPIINYQNNIDAKKIEALTKINIDEYAKNKELKNLQKDIKSIKSRVDFDKISRIRLDELSQLSYEDFQNIRKLKNKNGFQRSYSVSDLRNKNDIYKKNLNENLFLFEKEKNKEIEFQKLQNDMTSTQNLVLSLDLKIKNMRNQIDTFINNYNSSNQTEQDNNNKSFFNQDNKSISINYISDLKKITEENKRINKDLENIKLILSNVQKRENDNLNKIFDLQEKYDNNFHDLGNKIYNLPSNNYNNNSSISILNYDNKIKEINKQIEDIKKNSLNTNVLNLERRLTPIEVQVRDINKDIDLLKNNRLSSTYNKIDNNQNINFDLYEELRKKINTNEKSVNKQIEDLKKLNQNNKDDFGKRINFTENKITTFINSYNNDKTSIKTDILNLYNRLKKIEIK